MKICWGTTVQPNDKTKEIKKLFKLETNLWNHKNDSIIKNLYTGKSSWTIRPFE